MPDPNLDASLDSLGASINETMREYRKMHAALEECEEYFDQRADAEYFTDSASPVGNEEMRLLVMVREALGKYP